MIRKMFSTVMGFAFVLTAIVGLSVGMVMAQEEKGQETASFKITEQSLENLKSEGVPNDVLEKLQSLKNQEVIGEEKFLGILKETIGDEQAVRFKSLILKHARKEPEQLIKLPKVVVTAPKEAGYKTPSITSLTLINTPPLESPLSYEVMNKQSLEELGISRYIDAWEYTSGVRTSEAPLLFTASGGSSIVRGFRTETTINGFPIPQKANLFLNSAGIERIEYFKGSAAAIQGANISSSNGVGGGINLVTKTPSHEPFSNARAESKFGNGQSYRYQVDCNTPIAKNVLFRLNAATETERPFYLPSDCDSNTGLFLSPNLTLYPIDKLELTLEASYQHEEEASYYGIPPNVKSKQLCDIDTYYGNDDTRTQYEGVITQMRAKWTINDALTANAGVSQLHTKTKADIRGLSFGVAQGWKTLDFFNKVYATGTSPFSKLYSDATSDDAGYNVNLIAQHKFGKIDNALVAGYDYLRTESDTISSSSVTTSAWYSVKDPPEEMEFPAPRVSAPTESIVKRTGILLQEQLAWSSWRFLGGGRYDTHESDDGDTAGDISYRLGVTYLIKPNLATYGAFLNTQGPNFGLVDYEGKKITEGWSAKMMELGVKVEPTQNLLCTIAGFSIKEDNLPVRDPVLTDVAELTGEEESQGCEMTVSGNITDNWNARASYTYLRKDSNSAGKKVWQNVPSHDIAIWQTYRILSTNLKLGMGYKYVSERDLTYRGEYVSDEYKLPPYWVTDLFLEYSFKGKATPFLLRVDVDNVFNKKYFTGVRHVTKAKPGEPFGIMVSLSSEVMSNK